MMWAMIILGVLFVIGAILGGMGFLGNPKDDRDDHRSPTGTHFIDWML